MAVTEPYSALFGGIKTQLVGGTGPFQESDQVDYTAPNADGFLDPVEELNQRLAQTGRSPTALIADMGSDFGRNAVGDTDIEEEWGFSVHYAVRVPGGGQWGEAYTGDGSPYWGEFPTRKWIIQRLFEQNIPASGTVFRPRPVKRRPTIVAQKGVIAAALDFIVRYIHQKA